MRICRFLLDEQESFGIYLDDESVIPIRSLTAALGKFDLEVGSILDLLPGGSLHEHWRSLEAELTPELQQRLATPVGAVKLLTPLPNPGKFLLLAGNYPLHIKEGGGEAPERDKTIPNLFMKPNNTFTHPGDPIRIPACSPQQIDWELELGVVIGKTCSAVSEADALDYVAGYTVVNDISDRSYKPNPGRTVRPRDAFFDWQHGKWHDTFCPWGPCVLPSTECPDPQNLHLELRLNGEIEQNASTGDMTFPVAAIIEFISRFVTLHPGDVIATGTPDGVGKFKNKFLKPGDVLQAKIEQIGVLRNPVV